LCEVISVHINPTYRIRHKQSFDITETSLEDFIIQAILVCTNPYTRECRVISNISHFLDCRWSYNKHV